MTERPILMNTDMVLATLDGRKKQTRRLKGLESINQCPNVWNRQGDPMSYKNRLWDSTVEKNPNPLSVSFGFTHNDLPDGDKVYIKFPYGKVGDLFWVREAFQQVWKTDYEEDNDAAAIPNFDKRDKVPAWGTNENYWIFRADGEIPKHAKWGKFNWKPSIHMPKAAARLWLKISDIKVERLHEISEQDSIYEGVRTITAHNNSNRHLGWHNYLDTKDSFEILYSPRESFETLWESIHGTGSRNKPGKDVSWEANPWVWVVEFERVEGGRDCFVPRNDESGEKGGCDGDA